MTDGTNKMQELINYALSVRLNAYAPYSGFKVGAAVTGKSGKIYGGANVENASFGLTVCAERSALYAAVTAGEDTFSALVVVADAEPPVTPCGACLQVIRELCGNVDLIILCVNLQGEQLQFQLSELLPRPFAPDTSFSNGRLF